MPGVHMLKDKDVIAWADAKSREERSGAYYNFEQYLNLKDKESVKLKQSFFAVIIHGWITHVIPDASFQSPLQKENPELYGKRTWEINEFAPRVKQWWLTLGKKRAVLLLSCFTGIGVGRHLATQMGVSVVAPRAPAWIDGAGNIISANDSDIIDIPSSLDRPDWAICFPNGNTGVITPNPVLDKVRAIELVRNYTGGY